jgi:hypothetical protein
MPKNFNERFKSKIPEGQSGDWRIEKFTVTKEAAKDFNRSMAWTPGMGGRQIMPGDHTRLMRGNQLVMSDTAAEIRDHVDPYVSAEGHTLLTGLGLGVVAKMIASRGEVKSLTIIEKSHDVIKLVKPHLRISRMKIIEADIFTWKPHERFAELGIKQFDFAWFDIWDDFNEDFIAEKQKLYRRYGRWAKKKGNWLKNYFWEKA